MCKRFLFTTIIILVCSVIFVVPCVSQHSARDASCILPTAKSAQSLDKLISQENWEFTLPGMNWVNKEMFSPDIKAALQSLDPEHSALILFLKEDDVVSFTEYVIGTLRILSILDFNINAIRQVAISNSIFVLLQANKDDKMMWNWVTVKDNFGYNFTCAARFNIAAGNSQQYLCESIAQTLIIK